MITIRWPTAEQFARRQPKDTNSSGSKRRRSSISGSSDALSQDNIKSSEESASQLLFNIAMPANFATKRTHQLVKVYAPWIAAKCAENANLDSRQLRTIGINTSASASRSRRNRGEGNVTRRSCPIGNLHQVSVTSIPKAGTWKEGNVRSRDVECEQIWDKDRGAVALHEDERIERYMDTLQPFQKTQFIQTLHQSNYNFDAAKIKMDRKTTQIEVNVGPAHRSETTWQKCDRPHVMLEGTPLSQTEIEAFNRAILDHQKKFTIIARAVGTTVNRCLVHYYSTFKSGENVGQYLELKKGWEQSDECEVCNDGGKKKLLSVHFSHWFRKVS